MKKFILILLCFIALNNTFASSKKLQNDKYYITASNSFDIVMFSENEEKREEYKNNIIRFYETTPKFKEAVDKVYEEKKEEYKDKKNTEEYGRLLGIGSILEIK